MNQLKRILIWPIYMLVLRPLINHNYKLREQGKLPDEFYWADEIAANHLFFTSEFLGFIDIPKIKREIRWRAKHYLFIFNLKVLGRIKHSKPRDKKPLTNEERQKYLNVIQWWNSKLSKVFPIPMAVHPEVVTPEFVKEAERLLSNG